MPYSFKHKQDTRERIINSARRLFNRKGFTEVTIDDTRGQISIGKIPPIRSAALAAQGKKVRVASHARS